MARFVDGHISFVLYVLRGQHVVCIQRVNMGRRIAILGIWKARLRHPASSPSLHSVTSRWAIQRKFNDTNERSISESALAEHWPTTTFPKTYTCSIQMHSGCVCVCARACVLGGGRCPRHRWLLCHVGPGLRKHAEGEESFIAVSRPCVVPQLLIAFRMIRSSE
jgi:hypothetical protein